ncbi:MAG: hypothetical protein QOF66_1892, partial [Mycobacterium sp.]|nr:hypothetical protein [Mycobacterium sp.]
PYYWKPDAATSSADKKTSSSTSPSISPPPTHPRPELTQTQGCPMLSGSRAPASSPSFGETVRLILVGVQAESPDLRAR